MKISEVIKKINGKWYLYTHDGSKRLGGPYATRKQAVRRERQVNYFKYHREGDDEMPYPNEHAARVRDPGDFRPDSFRNKAIGSEGVRIIMGKLKGESKMIVQAYRFPKDKFTVAQAKKWLKDNDVKYISFEPASDKKEESMSGRGIRPSEAATVKSRVQGLIRDMKSLLDDKELPAGVRAELEKVRSHFKRTWDDLADEAGSEEGAQPVENQDAECGSEQPMYIPMSVQSFKDLDSVEQANVLLEEVKKRISQYTELSFRIIYDSANQPDQILPKMEALTEEYLEVIRAILDQGSAGYEEADLVTEGEPEALQLNESWASDAAVAEVIDLIESTTEPLSVDLQIIKPGWGNPHDRNYYPAEVLKRDASVFIGAKQYETDHRPEEKSTRTWVSTITKIVGFTDDGAPIGRAVVHDPGFAERLRNLKSAKLLDKMECSILAQGTARKGSISGQDGDIVESIVSVDAVDWVTRAGAGGQALDISETNPISDVNKEAVMTANLQVPPTVPVTTLVEGQEGAPPAPATPPEGTPGSSTPAPVVPPAPPAAVPPEAPPAVTAEAVAEALKKVYLPAVSLKRLQAGTYPTAEKLEEAIQAEITYVKALTGSGSDPAGGVGIQSLGETQKPTSLEEVEKKKDAVMAKYGFGKPS